MKNKKHITEIKRNFWGKEIKRIEYDIEIPKEESCRHHFIYKDIMGMDKTCKYCGLHLVWTGASRPWSEADYVGNTWLEIKKSK